jgi:hypothetical protein
MMNLYFESASDASRFRSRINDIGFTWKISRVEVKCPRSQKHVVLPHADILSIYRKDYATNDNPYSPKFIVYDMELESVSLDDEKQLQMFEKPPPNVEIGTYKCHIASKKLYKKYAHNENNIVNASWLFHQYFDGLVTKGIIPCLLVRPECAYEATTFSIGGREIILYRIVVLMDFTTEAGLEELLPYLHDGAELVGKKRLRTYIHASNPEEMCEFFRLKHKETTGVWKRKKVKMHTLPFLDVEYNCKHPASE